MVPHATELGPAARGLGGRAAHILNKKNFTLRLFGYVHPCDMPAGLNRDHLTGEKGFPIIRPKSSVGQFIPLKFPSK